MIIWEERKWKEDPSFRHRQIHLEYLDADNEAFSWKTYLKYLEANKMRGKVKKFLIATFNDPYSLTSSAMNDTQWTLDKHGIGWKLIEFAKRSKIPLAFRAAAALLYVNNNTFDHTSIHLYSILRFELIEIMRASGMNTQSATGPAGREIQRSQHHFFLANFFGRKSLWLVATNIYWGWYLSPRTADQPSSDTTERAASKRDHSATFIWGLPPSSPHRRDVIRCLAKTSNTKPALCGRKRNPKKKYISVLADQISPGDHQTHQKGIC